MKSKETRRGKKHKGKKTGKRFASVRMLADRYDVDTSTVWRWCKAGRFPQPTNLSPRCTRWDMDAVEAHEASRSGQAA